MVKKITKSLLCLVMIMFLGAKLHSQMSGVYTIPGSFANLAAAITSLNAVGVSGPVTVNIAAGYTETAPAGGYFLSATGTSANPIIFQKSGAGANPIITASTGTSTPASIVQDGVWRLLGSDYITIDGINLTDPATTNPATMEYGYGMFKASATNGCQNNTIKNCAITLSRNNNATGTAPAVDGSRGINVVSSLATIQNSILAPTSASGSNSNNRFYSNTIQNCNVGIALIGYADVSPFTFADANNDIGGTSSATGNTIINFGGAAAAANMAAAVRTLAQYSINASFNIINNNNGSGVNHPTTLKGIYLNTATSANASVLNNTLTLVVSAATVQASAIENLSGATAASNTIAIRNNLLVNCTNTTNTTGSFYGIYNNAASCAYLDISSNTFTNVTTGASSGSNYLIYNTGAVSNNISFNANLISGCTNVASSNGNQYCINNNAASSATLSASTNTFSSCSFTAGTGLTQLIYNSSALSGSIAMANNAINSCTSTSSSSASFYGIFNNGTSPLSLDMSGNTFANNAFTGATGTISLVYNTAAITNLVNMSNITMSGCTSSLTSTGSFYGIYNNGGATTNLLLSNNTFSNNISAAANGSVHLIYNRGTTANVFTNISINSNLITGCLNSSTAGASYLTVFNNGVTTASLSMTSNTITGTSWATTTSLRYLLANSAVVGTGGISISNNIFSSLTNSLNTTGVFYGIYNTGSSATDLNVSSNTFSANTSVATSGAMNLMLNSGTISSNVTFTNNLITGCTNSATAAGDFYGISNSGTLSTAVNISNNTFTNTTLVSSTGAANFVFNTGGTASNILNLNLNNNLIANCSSTITSTGSFYGVYNSAASAANLSLNNNTVTTCSNTIGAGSVVLFYNRGATTNTFSSIQIDNNQVSAYTFSAAGGAFYGVYNNGVTSANLDISTNTFTNLFWNTMTSNRFLINNSGINTIGNLISGNIFSSLTNTLNTTGIFYGIFNAPGATSSGALAVTNNTFTNNNLTATTGGVQLISSSGIINNTISINNNLISNYTSTITGTGVFYGIWNQSASNANLNVMNNSFLNSVSSTSTGATYFVYNTGAITGGIALDNNSVSGFTNSAASAAFYGVYNAGAAGTMDGSANTFTNITFATTAANHYMVYNTGAVTTSNTYTNNILSNITNTLNTGGNFYGVANLAGATSAAVLTMKNNTVISNVFTGTAGVVQLLSSSGTINNAVNITNNLITSQTSSLTGTAVFYGINNASASNANLAITDNTLTNSVSNSSTSATYFIYTTGAATNTITLNNNSVSGYTNVTTSGPFYGIYNNGGASANLDASTNTFTNIIFNAAAGNRYLINNSGLISSNATFTSNVISAITHTLNTTGIFYGILNGVSGTATGALTVANNTITNSFFAATAGSVQILTSSGTNNNAMTFSGNLISGINSSLTGVGAFYGIYNASASNANLVVANNTFTNSISTTSTGPTFLIYNASAVTNSISLSSNSISGFTMTSGAGSFYGIYSIGTTNNMDASTNTFNNLLFNTTAANRYMIYNSGSVGLSNNYTNNTFANLTNTLNTSGSFYGIANLAGTSTGSLNIVSNTFTNTVFNGTAGVVQLISSSGTINNNININTNLVSGYSSTLTGTGIFYGIYNASASNGSLNIGSNTFINGTSTTFSTGTYLVYNTGGNSSAINLDNNSISSFTNTSTSGNFYGVCNTGTAVLLEANTNTITNILFATTGSNRYMIYNTGIVSGSNSYIGNVISNLTNTLNTSGIFYGIAHATTGTSTGSLSIDSNTLTNNNLAATSGGVQVISSSGTINNIASITNNIISGYTSSISLAGNFIGISNASASNANLVLANNTLTNITSTVNSGGSYFVYNTGAATNSISLFNNSLSNCSVSSASTGAFYGVYNNGASASNFDMSSNTLSGCVVTTSAGAICYIYNRGVSTNTFNIASITNNLITGGVQTATASSIYSILNSGVTAVNLSIAGNTVTNNNWNTVSSNRFLISNGGIVTATASITNNLLTNCTATANTTGQIYGIQNGAQVANLDISNNNVNNISSASTSGTMALLLNTSNVTNTMSISNNIVSNCTNSATSSAPFFGISNNAITSNGININGNTFNNCVATTSTGAVAMIYNNGLTTSTVAVITISNNIISGTTNTATGNGAVYGIYNSSIASGNLNIVSNNFNNHNCNTTTSARYGIYNTGKVTNTLSIASNTIANNTYTSNTTGNLYGILNAIALPGYLSIDNNAFINNVAASTTGTTYAIYNSTAVTGTTSITNNIVASNTHTSSANGTFFGIANFAGPSSAINIDNNKFSNCAVTTNTAAQYMIYNNGLAASNVSSLSISNNSLASFNSSITATAAFYGIFNNLISSNYLSISGNALSNHTVVTTTSPRYMIYNTGSVTATANFNSNIISGCQFTTNTTGGLYGIYNTAACPLNLSIDANTFDSNVTAATTGTTYLVYNTGANTSSVDISNNVVSNHSSTVTGTGQFLGLVNNGSSCTDLTMTGNTFTNSAVTSSGQSTYLVYSTGPTSVTITRISLNNNTVSNFTNTTSSAAFYAIINNVIHAGDLRMDGNTVSGNNLVSNPGDIYLVHNNAPVTNTISMSGNKIANGLYTSGTPISFYGIYNKGISTANLTMDTNTLTGNAWSVSTGTAYLLYNIASAANTISISNNLIAGSTTSANSTGLLYNIFNNNAPSTDLSINGNSFTNNATDVLSGDLALIYNTGATTGSLSIQNNNLSYAFNNATQSYQGNMYGIYNTNGAASTSLNISGNNFSNYVFQSQTGFGSVYFIYNSNNNANLSMDNNSWTNLSLNNSGGHYLMYNASGTQSLLSVTNNSIITGFSRTSGAGNMYGYYSASPSPASGSQIISGNNFSNISATNSGIGSFNGIYSNDGTTGSMAQKTIFNNVISNVSYNSIGNFIGIYANYLGDASSVGSSVYSNSLSAVNWLGGVYGLYTGQNISSTTAADMHSNLVTTLFSSGAGSSIYSVLLGSGGAGINFYKNKIGDITQNGSSGVVNGVYVSGSASTTLYNNIIGDLKTPNSSAFNAVNGFYIASGPSVNAYYNTIDLNATSIGSNFNTNAIYAASTTSLILKNNIFINSSTPNGSGITAAFRRSASSQAYGAASDRNIFYAGTPGTSNVIYTDGSTTYQGFPTFQAAVAPRDANSGTENTPFLSSVFSATNFLHVDPTLPSLAESGASAISGIADDFDGQVRQGNPGYTGTGAAPDIGADEFEQNLPPCSSAGSGTVSPASSIVCEDQPISLESAGFTYTAAGGITHQWEVSNTSGGPYTAVTGGGAHTLAYTSGTLTAGNYYYVLVTTCTLSANTNTSNQVSVLVNPLPSVSVSVSSSTLCSGGTISFNASTNTGTIFAWTGPDNYNSAQQNPVINNANTTSSGIYSLEVSNGTCINKTISPYVLVNATPPPFMLTPSLTGVCAGNSQTVSASAAISSPTLVSGTHANQNGPTGYPAPYSVYYGGQKMQMLITAAELTSAGFINGTPITSLQFPVVSLGSNWGSTVNDIEDFKINIGLTSVASLTTFQTALTNVLVIPSYTPTVGNNVHNFATPFEWDGVSNVVLETTFSNNTAGTPGNTVISYNSPTSFLSTIVYRADNQSAATIEAATTPNTSLGVERPDFKLNGISVGTYSWSPTSGLSSSTTQSTVATPSATTIYTVTLYNAACSSTAVTTLNLVQIPTLSIVSSNSSICAGNAATLSVTGALSYTWNTGISNDSIAVSPSGSTTYSVTGENFPCPSVTGTVALPVTPAILLTAIASPSNVCQGDSTILTAGGAISYTWSSGANTASTAVTPTVNTTYTVIGTTGSGCTGHKTISVITSSAPALAVSPLTQTTCANEEVIFTASGANTYVWMPDGFNLPVYTDYPIHTTSYTVVGMAANTCTTAITVTAVVSPCTDIKNSTLANSGIRVFPNPTGGMITVASDAGGSKEIQLSDAIGNLMKIVTTTSDTETLDLSVFAKGVYFIKVKSNFATVTYRVILAE